jgi:hypothetical protein
VSLKHDGLHENIEWNDNQPISPNENMSSPFLPKPAKLVVGLFMQEKGLIHALTDSLVANFGTIDLVSAWFPFDYTTYYEPEMGTPLFRRMLAFKTLIEQSSISAIKIITNDLELKFSINQKRRVNIDPGYLVHERFVLATGKNYTHRIYLDKGIYADLTLIYTKGAFQKLPWTYPDYADKRMLGYLHRVRNKYLEDIKRIDCA